jgi:hypothetical protein
MISDVELAEIEAREAAATGIRWKLGSTQDGRKVVLIEFGDGSTGQISVTREDKPAGEDDVAFIAHSRDDVRALVASLRNESQIPFERLEDATSRCKNASPSPWKVFLESDGGVGGNSVIWVSDADAEPDLYLWVDSEPAADADFEFVAAVRQDLPRLLAAARERLSE